MVSSYKVIDQEGNAPLCDEGWWASVLSDEEWGIIPRTPTKRRNKEKNAPIQKIDWDYVQLIYETDTVVTLKVYGFNRGGVLVNGHNFHGFVPISHLMEPQAFTGDMELQINISTIIGKQMQLKVIECNRAHDRIVLSERAAAAGDGCRKQVFFDLSEGSVAEGTVTNITVFGVFVDLGGVEGLIHVSELSWGRVNHPSEIVCVGEKIQTIVLQICEDTSRVALSLKRLQPNPWETLLNLYQPGDIVRAQITNIMHFGAFARMENGIEGLIHNSTLLGDNPEIQFQDILSQGQLVEVRILHIDIEKRRMGLGLVVSE